VDGAQQRNPPHRHPVQAAEIASQLGARPRIILPLRKQAGQGNVFAETPPNAGRGY